MKKVFICWNCERHFDDDPVDCTVNICEECYQSMEDYLKVLFYKNNLIDKEKMSKETIRPAGRIEDVVGDLQRVKDTFVREIKRIDERIDRFNQQESKEEEWVENGYFMPKDDDVAYYPEFNQNGLSIPDTIKNIDEIFIDILYSGLSFKTEEAAAKKGRQMIARRKLMEAIREYNDGWVPDYNNRENKFNFYFQGGRLLISATASKIKAPIELVMKDDLEDQTEKFLGMSEDEIILAIWGIEDE